MQRERVRDTEREGKRYRERVRDKERGGERWVSYRERG
jgi:hypothetical protein